MAKFDYITPWVQKALSSGLGPTAGLRTARDGGLRVQDSRWYRAYGTERMNVALQNRFRDPPLNRRPAAEEIGQWETVRKRGFAYRVRGVMQDRETGAEKIVTVTVTTDNLISRGNAINQAMENFADPDEKYPGVLMAAFVTGVYRMTPGEE